MAKGAIRISWRPVDALHGMRGLTVFEELAYRRILDLLYSSGGQLRDDDTDMRESTRVFKMWPKVKAGLLSKGKIQIFDGWITNIEATKELENIREKSVKARASRQVELDKRRQLLPPENERTFNERSNVRSTNEVTIEQLVNIVTIVERESNDSLSPIAGESAQDDFKTFWKAYPNKAGEYVASVAWRKAVTEWGHAAPEVQAGLNWWLAKWKAEGTKGRHIPEAVNWLTARRFLDGQISGSPIVPLAKWTGPADIRNRLVGLRGEKFAETYLDAAEWLADDRTILTKTQTAADRLKMVLGSDLTIMKKPEIAA